MRMSTAGRPGGIGAKKERQEQKQSTNVPEGGEIQMEPSCQISTLAAGLGVVGLKTSEDQLQKEYGIIPTIRFRLPRGLEGMGQGERIDLIKIMLGKG